MVVSIASLHVSCLGAALQQLANMLVQDLSVDN